MLRGLINLVHDPSRDLDQNYLSNNRVSSTGKALEFYVQDMLCGVPFDSESVVRKKAYESHLSYFEGSQNHPPDFMVKNGDAVEVKKLETRANNLALNSSFPKSKLYVDDHRITQECRDCEVWKERDHLYAIGLVEDNILQTISFVYGDCIAADRKFYSDIEESVKRGLVEHGKILISPSNELARANNVDPLNLTNLRVRGMWILKNPVDHFDFLGYEDSYPCLRVEALMLKTKYDSFPAEDIKKLRSLDGVTAEEKQIPSPNDPELQLEAVHISCSLQV